MMLSMHAFISDQWMFKSSRKHAYTIFDPFQPHFYIVKLGFTGVYIIFLISVQKHIVGTS